MRSQKTIALNSLTELERLKMQLRRAEETLREIMAQLPRKDQYQTIMSTVTRHVHESINLQEVLENAVEVMSKNIDEVDIVSIFLVEGQEAVLKAHRGLPGWFIEREGKIPYPKGFTWKTIIEGKPIYCADTDKDTNIDPTGRELETKSYVSMPIKLKGKTVGTININSFKGNAFDEGKLKLLEFVSQQIEMAINNAQQAETLRESEERFRLLVEGVKDYAIFMLDTGGHIVSWNAGAEHIKGYRTEEIIGKHFSIFYPAEDAEHGKPQHALDTAIAKGRCEDEGWRVRKDGSQFWANVVITALRDESENLRGFSKVTRDITERKRAEEALKQISSQMELILNSAGEGIFGLDSEANTTFINLSGAKMIGWEADELIGRHQHDIVHHSKPDGTPYPQEECPVYMSLKNGVTRHVSDEVFWRKDGTSFPVEYISTPIQVGRQSSRRSGHFQ